MNKIHFALCSILLLASCGGSAGEDPNRVYIESFAKAYDSSYASGSYYVTTSEGMKIGAGIKNLNDVYYHLKGEGLTFNAGLKGVKGSDASSLQGQFLLTGGSGSSLKLDTNSTSLSDFKNFLGLTNLKAKAYFDGSALYFDGSENSNIGLLAQTLIKEISGDSSYRLYGGGYSLDNAKNKYKGKWTLSEENAKKISDKMPLVKDGDTLSEHFSLSSFIEGAYEDSNGKTAFDFSTKDDGTKVIDFQSTDKTVLGGAMKAGFASFSSTLDTSSSLPSESEVKERIDEFFTYAEAKVFHVRAFFTDSALTQVYYDVNFSFAEEKVKEAFPEGMFDFSENASEGSDPNDYRFNVDGSLSFSGTLRTSFGKEGAFSLPDDLSEYLEFPEIKSSSEE